MRLRLAGLLRDLAGKSEQELLRHLDHQVSVALRGADFIREALTDGLATSVIRDELNRIESEGDAGRRRLVDELARLLTTPVDREDLFRLSRSIDDVLDNLRDFARELDLYEPDEKRAYLPLVAALVEGLADLRIAVAGVADDLSKTTALCLEAKKSGNQVRRAYQQNLALALRGNEPIEVLKQRELFRRLDVAGIRLGEAADALADGAMKRSQ